jgi:hypothetical protein
VIADREDKDPPKLPMGVRIAEIIYASFIYYWISIEIMPQK